MKHRIHILHPADIPHVNICMSTHTHLHIIIFFRQCLLSTRGPDNSYLHSPFYLPLLSSTCNTSQHPLLQPTHRLLTEQNQLTFSSLVPNTLPQMLLHSIVQYKATIKVQVAIKLWTVEAWIFNRFISFICRAFLYWK